MMCPYATGCRMILSMRAELFLHQQLHADSLAGFGGYPGNLWTLPYIFHPRIAHLMEDYHQHRLSEERGDCTDGGGAVD